MILKPVRVLLEIGDAYLLQRGTSGDAVVQDVANRSQCIQRSTASLEASPRLDFGVSPNCASRLRELTAQDGVAVVADARGMVSG
jgi:hypothetical protein